MKYSVHNIFVNNPHPQSLAALVLLTKKLAPKPHSYRVWLKYRKWYIKEHLKSHKELSCFYCGKKSLKKNSDTSNDLATLDHIRPVSKGGPRYLSTNIVIACSPCNGKKQDKSIEEFIGLLKRDMYNINNI